MTIKLYNTLSRQKQEFIPSNPQSVGMYVCGPTVYDRAHIGNARSAVVFDVLYRLLQHCYGQENIRYVRNITDIDDKINKAAIEKDVSIHTLTEETTRFFHEDMSILHCLPPTIEPKATKHIDLMKDMIEKLIVKNCAYVAKGHVLFDVSSYHQYGSLSGKTVDALIAGARVEIAPYKKHAGDFILWKPSQPQEPGWPSVWGRGRPGWHIECSAMCSHYLGTSFDIHGGGTDLQFPHHENEIAQSCSAFPDSQYARYWVHNGFLTVNDEKMSKSLGNIITLHDLVTGKKIKGEVIRYALLVAHYRKPLDWNDKGIQDATKALYHFYQAIADFAYSEKLTFSSDLPNGYLEALMDDLNTPQALSILHKLATKITKTQGKERSRLQHQMIEAANMIGLLNAHSQEWLQHKEVDSQLKATIEALIKERTIARQEKKWHISDRIRLELEKQNVMINDKADGTTDWWIA